MKKRTTEVLLSGLVCPGAGQIYGGRYVRGAALMAATAALAAAVAYKTWTAAEDAILSMPPDELMGGILPLAGKVLESGRGFYDACGAALVAVWAAGIIEAYFSGRWADRCRKKNTT